MPDTQFHTKDQWQEARDMLEAGDVKFRKCVICSKHGSLIVRDEQGNFTVSMCVDCYSPITRIIE